ALSLWNLDDISNLAIIEAGISRPGEMASLQRMIRPDIAVLTNIGAAHEEGFASVHEKVTEKLKLFTNTETAVFSPDYLDGVPMHHTKNSVTWGKNEVALQVRTCKQLKGGHYQIHATFRGKLLTIVIPFTDAASRENALCCWAVMLAMGYPQSIITERMAL